ncbi:MAG: M23 family metallopeptidase [Firmicutes bacterium]|nr:M23 family metallopeptidase [Bacillota bacterium]
MSLLNRILFRLKTAWRRIIQWRIWRKVLLAVLIYLFFLTLTQLHFSPIKKVLAHAQYVFCEYQLSLNWEQLSETEWLQKPGTWLPVYKPLQSRQEESPAPPGSSKDEKGMMLMPLAGEVTSGFGWRHHPVLLEERFHYGIDIAAPEGTVVRAAAGGLVSRVEETEDLGLVVSVDHGASIETIYAHCSEVLVEENQPVQRGEIIARVGSTGLSENPHLHFEIKEGGVNVDPAVWLDLLAGDGS